MRSDYALTVLLALSAVETIVESYTSSVTRKSYPIWKKGSNILTPEPRSRIRKVPPNTTPAQVIKMNLKFKLSARNLMKKDRNGASDPYVVVTYTQEKGQGAEIFLGKTSVVMDNSNPNWPDVFNITYVEGTRQKIHFMLWDKDAFQDDRFGKVWLYLGDYVRNNQFARRYLHPGFLIMEKA